MQTVQVDRQCCVQSVTRILFSPVLVVSWVWMFQYPCFDSSNKLGGGGLLLFDREGGANLWCIHAL